MTPTGLPQHFYHLLAREMKADVDWDVREKPKSLLNPNFLKTNKTLHVAEFYKYVAKGLEEITVPIFLGTLSTLHLRPPTREQASHPHPDQLYLPRLQGIVQPQSPDVGVSTYVQRKNQKTVIGQLTIACVLR